MIGFGEYGKDQVESYHSYTEFHGEIDPEIRTKNLADFNQINNVDGSNNCLVMYVVYLTVKYAL